MIGNWVCLVGYALVLWRFFKKRIESELTHCTIRRILADESLTKLQKRKNFSSSFLELSIGNTERELESVYHSFDIRFPIRLL